MLQVELEKKKPQSQERHAIGKLPQLWGESLYILAKLITEVCIFSLIILSYISSP